jgi:hypothetical protein
VILTQPSFDSLGFAEIGLRKIVDPPECERNGLPGGIALKKIKKYKRVRFGLKTLREANSLFRDLCERAGKKGESLHATVTYQDEEWQYDTIDEFLSEYPKSDSYFLYQSIETATASNNLLSVVGDRRDTNVEIKLPTRPLIESVFGIFERDLQDSIVSLPEAPVRVFIGHGHDPQWKDLKDHLREKHGFGVQAYETGPRAGATVKEVLEELSSKSSFACLVMTGEDSDELGEMHARENVIHELGFFQGRLGFRRALALIEEGVKEFSNIEGVAQLRFSKGNIQEIFGDVVAAIRKEFPRVS